MRKLAFALTFILLLASCSKDSQMILASFDVEVPDVASTRARVDGDGAGASINRCILQIWADGRIQKNLIVTAPSGTKMFSFGSVPLISGPVYDFLVWADCGNADGSDLYYDTFSLKNVSIKSFDVACNDALDAFCNQPDDSLSVDQKLIGQKVTDNFSRKIVLKRPLSQMNLITKDFNMIKSVDLATDLTPKSVDFSYSACTAFDVYANKSAGGLKSIEYINQPIYNLTTSGTIAMSYLFPQDGEEVTTVSFTIKSISGAKISTEATNVPFKRNYRTNISGSLLTEIGNFSIIVEPQCDGEKDIARIINNL